MKYGNGFVGLFALGWTGTQKAGVTLELFSRTLNQKIDQKKSEGWTLGYFTPDCPWWLLITGIKKNIPTADEDDCTCCPWQVWEVLDR